MGNGEQEKWYLRFHGEAVGPFPSFQIARYLLLKRLHHDDEISLDKRQWHSIREVKEVWPENRLAASGISDAEKQRLESTQRWVETHPALFVPLDEVADAEAELLFEDGIHHPQHHERRATQGVVGYLVALLLAAAAITVPFLLPEGPPGEAPQCDAAPAPGVNWSNCRLEGSRLENADLRQARLRNANLSAAVLRAANLAESDLAYANLSLANLRGANLAGAVLTGANLRRADLRSANLSNTDLSYADLTDAVLSGAQLEGARLGYAVLGEETLCMPESVGSCIPGKR